MHAKPIELRLMEVPEKAPQAPNEIQLFKVGTFKHPQVGQFKITPDFLKTMVTNFKDKVRGIDLSIDYQHNNEDVAGAWIKDLKVKDNNSLWAEVDWTPRGKKAIEDKEFRYISPEFSQNYKSNEDDKSFGPTLLGAGLTNRPFLKGMDPIVELAENKENEMDPKEIEAMKAKIAQLEQEKKDADQKASSFELKLSETQKAADQLKADKEKADKNAKFDVMLKDGKVCEAQRESYIAGDLNKFTELAMTVKLTEKGSRGNGDQVITAKDGKEAQAQILKLAEKMVKEDKITMDKAISLVLKEPSNKTLREQYEASTSVRQEGGI